MKLMNEIESKTAGRVARILVENSQPVEYGQPLFYDRPLCRSSAGSADDTPCFTRS